MHRTVREAPETTPGWKRESQNILARRDTLRKDNLAMKVEYSSCAGLDVHKRVVVASVLKGEPGREPVTKPRALAPRPAN
jgi:hypothetical protein